MNRYILVALFETIVFLDIVQVIPSNNDSSVHFHLCNDSSKDATTNGHFASKRALLVYVVSLSSLNHTKFSILHFFSK